jgi:hypothetical protein
MHSVEPFDNATIRRIMHRVTLVGEGPPIAARAPQGNRLHRGSRTDRRNLFCRSRRDCPIVSTAKIR